MDERAAAGAGARGVRSGCGGGRLGPPLRGRLREGSAAGCCPAAPRPATMRGPRPPCPAGMPGSGQVQRRWGSPAGGAAEAGARGASSRLTASAPRSCPRPPPPA